MAVSRMQQITNGWAAACKKNMEAASVNPNAGDGAVQECDPHQGNQQCTTNQSIVEDHFGDAWYE